MTATTTTNGANHPRRSGVSEPGNPTVVPLETLSRFHFAFLIRHPRRSIPSYYRCCVPPQSEVTGFTHYMPAEAGYIELVRLFDLLRERGLVGPALARDGERPTPGTGEVSVTVIDADDLLDDPAGTIEAYCHSVHVPFDPAMLRWDTDADHEHARAAFAKWKGFHDDAIDSREFRPRKHKSGPAAAAAAGGVGRKSEEQFDEEWRGKFGEEGARAIREVVDANMKHYEYLRRFAMSA